MIFKTPAQAFAMVFLFSLGLFVGCKPGDGGNATITGQVKHHDELIPGAQVYIKYGAEEQPSALSDYDDQTTASTVDATYIFEGLRKGKYYIYGSGFDEAFDEDVVGGIPVRITGKDEILQTDIPVTE